MPRTKRVKKSEREEIEAEIAKSGAPKKRARARGSSAVMQQRTECPDSLDFFPTPCWATRAFCEVVLRKLGFSLDALKKLVCAEPAAGESHMSGPLGDYFSAVRASDVHDYGQGHRIASYVGEGSDVLPRYEGDQSVDWIITNPPFNEAVGFARRALTEARVGVALLVRLAWIESEERWKVFSEFPPTVIAQYVERCPMFRGVFDPNGSSATAYCWVIWIKPYVVPPKAAAGLPPEPIEARMLWIPPGQKERFTRRSDLVRYAKLTELPLFGDMLPQPQPKEKRPVRPLLELVSG